MRRKFFLICFLSVLLSLALTTKAQYDESGNLIHITEENSNPLVYRLPNGLTVILHSDPSQPQVTGMVVVRTGGKNDLPEATGMAHYMEHMLFKGTTKIGTTDWGRESVHISRIFELYDSLALAKDPQEKERIQQRINEESVAANQYAIPNELDRILKEMGSTGINAGTGPDYTVFYNIFPPHQMDRWLEVYSHRFVSPVFRSFQAELEVVYEEKNMYADMFFMQLFEEFNRNFYKVHPYGQQPLIGTMDHLKNPSLTKMREFYERWYVANNMALILTGDFELESVLPVIQDKFGQLPSAPLPKLPTWVEAPFDGRELVEKKMSPVKIGLLGFRIPENGHRDKLTLEVMSQILSNGNATGLLDKLKLDNQLLEAACQNVHYNDYGTGLIIFVPKIAGQSLEDAENLILAELAKLRNGEFSDTLLEAIKLNMYREKMMALESSTSLAYAFMEVYTSKGDYNEVWTEPMRVREITRDEIIRVANEYYGENFLAFHSKMGLPKKDKIEKPGYEPVVKKDDATSDYYTMIGEMPGHPPVYQFVDFENDIQRYETDMGYKFYRVANPHNDVYTLTMKYGIGEGKMPILKYVSQMMNLAGAGELSVEDFRMQMAMLGCTYDIGSNDSYLIISMSGLEENLPKALGLMNTLVQNPVLDQKKLSILRSAERVNRKLERSEPDMIADALVEYVLYGQQSRYLNRLTMKQIKNLRADSLVAAFQQATQYMPEIHYVGTKSLDEINMLFSRVYRLPGDVKPSTSPFYRAPKLFLENGVYVTHKKRALQSKIFFHATLEEFDPQKAALYTAFNTYFGGDFSGIVLQEIREYRSMAYSAGAGLVQPPVKGQRMIFSGYIGTQSDKTNEAVDVFVDLVRRMPQKPERIGMIKRYVISAAVTQRPGFRRLSESYVNWTYKGFEKDPTALMLENIRHLEPNDVFDYQKMNLNVTPLTIIMAGNAKQIDTKALARYGKVTIVKEKTLFSK
ncbi:MAG: insulinase family protein [Bacteroidales bacterium]